MLGLGFLELACILSLGAMGLLLAVIVVVVMTTKKK